MMADNKKYYYIRLKDNFFDSNEIVLLESMQDGYLYSNILLKLYLRSLKDNGKLMFNDRIPYNPQMLATITRHQVGTVEKALKIFQEMGLIEVFDDGAIYMLDIQNFIGESSTEADRQRVYYNKIKQEQKLCKISCKKSTPEIELELKDRDKDKNRNRNRDRENTEYIISDEMNDTEYTTSDEAVPGKFMNIYFYFLRKYQETFHKSHDQLSESALQKVLKAFQDEDITEEYIDVYFGSSEHKGLKGNSDGSIFHFISPNVMDICRVRVMGSCYT